MNADTGSQKQKEAFQLLEHVVRCRTKPYAVGPTSSREF